jgi:hypothetical protein
LLPGQIEIWLAQLEGVVQIVPVRPSTWTAGLANHWGSFFFDDSGNLGIVLGLRTARLNYSEYLFFERYVSCDRVQGRQFCATIALAALETSDRLICGERND